MVKGPLRVPESAQAVAAAGQSALQAAMAQQFTKYTRTRRVKKRNQQESKVWIISPGTLRFLRTAALDLLDNGKAHKALTDHGRVAKIAVGTFDDQETVHIWVTDPLDPDGFEVDTEKDQWEANIAEFFMGSGLARAVGLKEKFDLLPGPSDHPNAPTLMFYLDKPVARSTFETSRKKKDEKKKTSPPGEDKAKGPDAKGAPPALAGARAVATEPAEDDSKQEKE